MITTKWLQCDGLGEVHELRKKVFVDELKYNINSVEDIFDSFAYNVLVFEDEKPVATGRLLFKDLKYTIDNVCVLSEYRGKHYGDLVIRLLVRKAVTIGADKTYANVNKDYKHLFETIGFTILNDKEILLEMVKVGDVGGGCC